MLFLSNKLKLLVMHQLEEIPFIKFLFNILKLNFPTGFVQMGHIYLLFTVIQLALTPISI